MKDYDEEEIELIKKITGIEDSELAQEAMKVLIAQMSLNEEF